MIRQGHWPFGRRGIDHFLASLAPKNSKSLAASPGIRPFKFARRLFSAPHHITSPRNTTPLLF
ncbi:hypothetical protein BC629DRAFT_1553170, partial [Irpex lacteus]